MYDNGSVLFVESHGQVSVYRKVVVLNSPTYLFRHLYLSDMWLDVASRTDTQKMHVEKRLDCVPKTC